MKRRIPLIMIGATAPLGILLALGLFGRFTLLAALSGIAWLILAAIVIIWLSLRPSRQDF
jgi:hypothetical protein